MTIATDVGSRIFDRQYDASGRNLSQTSITTANTGLNRSPQSVNTDGFGTRKHVMDVLSTKGPDLGNLSTASPNKDRPLGITLAPETTTENNGPLDIAVPSLLQDKQSSGKGGETTAPVLRGKRQNSKPEDTCVALPDHDLHASARPGKPRKTVHNSMMASAIMAGDQGKVRTFLGHEYEVDCRNHKGYTILLLAARVRQESIMNLAATFGADRWAVTQYGQTISHVVSNPTDWRGPLTRSIMEQILQRMPSLERKEMKYGNTLLLAAAAYGSILAAECLLEHGANISAVDNIGHTPIHLAFFFGHIGMIKLLIARGACTNTGFRSSTPLHIAVSGCADERKCVECIRILLESGAG